MKAKSTLLVFFACAVLLIGGSIYYAATTERAQKTMAVVPAPDGKYKAVRLRVFGETPEPYCVDTIGIFLSIYPDSFVASERSYEVYGAPCAAPGKRDTLPKIEWLDHKTVRITYATAGDKPPRMRDKDGSLFVDIQWVKVE